jgi:hypothetical protein
LHFVKQSRAADDNLYRLGILQLAGISQVFSMSYKSRKSPLAFLIVCIIKARKSSQEIAKVQCLFERFFDQLVQVVLFSKRILTFRNFLIPADAPFLSLKLFIHAGKDPPKYLVRQPLKGSVARDLQGSYFLSCWIGLGQERDCCWL